jgi:hypothetical protein
MIKTYYSSLIRGLGTLILLLGGILTFLATREGDEASRDLLEKKVVFDVSKPYSELSEAEKRERTYQIVINNIAENVEDLNHARKRTSVSSIIDKAPFLAVLGFIGTGFVALSFFIECLSSRC